jgi:hypothetical protein
VNPGEDANSNKVYLSLATTVAYDVSVSSGVKGKTKTQLSSYKNILKIVQKVLNTTENSLDAQKQPDLATFAEAVLAGVKLDIARDKTIQAQLTEALKPAVQENLSSNTKGSGASSGTTESLEVFLTRSFSGLLKDFVTFVSDALNDNTKGAGALFKADTYDPNTLPDPETYSSTIYSPTVAFNDVDTTASIGGEVVITPPTDTTGIEGKKQPRQDNEIGRGGFVGVIFKMEHSFRNNARHFPHPYLGVSKSQWSGTFLGRSCIDRQCTKQFWWRQHPTATRAFSSSGQRTKHPKLGKHTRCPV